MSKTVLPKRATAPSLALDRLRLDFGPEFIGSMEIRLEDSGMIYLLYCGQSGEYRECITPLEEFVRAVKDLIEKENKKP